MRTTVTDNRVESLQALRGLAFLGIFLSHAHFHISWPSLGVSIFLVLSGFLMMYRYYDHGMCLSFKNNVAFSIGKIKKLYPLHIITMCFAIIVYFVIMVFEGISISAIGALAGRIILNIFLMQSWYPNDDVNASLNGVAWFLSVMMFLYFIFPWIKEGLKKLSQRVSVILCLTAFALEIVLCMGFYALWGEQYYRAYSWFSYCFPVIRAVDFVWGCVLGKLFFEIGIKKVGRIRASLYEVLSVVITIGVFLWKKKESDSLLSLVLHNYTIIYIPLALIWTMLFAINKGIITKLLVNKALVYLGNISAYTFLIHFVITLYFYYGLKYSEITVNGFERAILVGIQFTITILLSEGYRKVNKNGGFIKRLS